MKKYLFLLGILLLTCANMSAQSSMTDEQIIRFVMKEQKAGSTQQEIAVKLVQKGVTTDQIKRVQQKAERLQKDQGLGTMKDKTLGTDTRQRKNNGDEKKTDDNNSTLKLKDKKQRRISLDDDDEKTTETEAEALKLKKELDIFMPDSFDIYDQKVIKDYLKAKDEYEKRSKKKIFGHDLFQNEDLTFEPAMNSPPRRTTSLALAMLYSLIFTEPHRKPLKRPSHPMATW